MFCVFDAQSFDKHNLHWILQDACLFIINEMREAVWRILSMTSWSIFSPMSCYEYKTSDSLLPAYYV